MVLLAFIEAGLKIRVGLGKDLASVKTLAGWGSGNKDPLGGPQQATGTPVYHEKQAQLFQVVAEVTCHC